jgi:subtilase family serine protease
MRLSQRVFFGLLLMAAGFAVAAPRAMGHGTPVPSHSGPKPIPENAQYVTLKGNTRPEANAENDRGRVPDSLPMDHMMLQLRRSPGQERALQVYMEQQTDPKSPVYHQWLTPEEFGERYGLAQEDLKSITGWLQSSGFTVNKVYPSGMMIDFSGTAWQVREAFRTEIHNLEVNGVPHIANMSDPQIPASLAPLVAGIVSLNDFRPHTSYKPRAEYTFAGTNGTEYVVVPPDLATIYNLNPLFTAGISGQGQTIVLIEDTDLYTIDDWTTFRSTFGLSSYTDGILTTVHPGECTDPGVNDDDSEAAIDVEWSSAAAPSAVIELASCANTETSFGGLIALQNLINASNPPAIMSISYGECEAFNGATSNAAYNSAYQQAASEGVSVFVATGDEGAASCDANENTATHGIGVSGFASTPYNVAVGGTDFGDTFAGTNGTYWNTTNGPTYGSALSYIPEIPWNDTCASVLLSTFISGSGITYGTNGFCNSTSGEELPPVTAGSGGPSGCATGVPAVSGVVGGTCAGYPKPSWQSGIVGNPGDGVRDLPDVSLFAGNNIWGHYYVICFSDPNNMGLPCTGAPSGWAGAGGTSFASPVMAAIQSLVNQKTAAAQGNPNPTYYQLAATEYGSGGNSACNSTLGNEVASTCNFYDVTLGDMDVNCIGTNNCYLPSGINGVLSTLDSSYLLAYGTDAGWDFATGIGTVNANNLVNNWPSSSQPSFTLSASPSSLTVTRNSDGTSTITVNPLNGFTGTVSLSASGLPTGVTAAFNPTSTTTTSVLTLTAGATAPAGTFTLTITGISGSLTETTPVVLTVTGPTTATTTTVTSSNPSVPMNTSVTFTATITPAQSGGPVLTGTVQFTANGVDVGSAVTVSNGVAATSTSTLAAGTYTIEAAYSGDSDYTASSGMTTQTITAAADFGITANPTGLTVAPGGTGTSALTLTALNGFTGTITFACSGLPAESSCLFSPASITTSGTATLTVSTTAASLVVPGTGLGGHSSPWSTGAELSLALLLGSLLMLMTLAAKKQRWSLLAGLGVLTLLTVSAACGGGSSSGNAGTPAGTYTVTVTATSGTLSHTVPLTLTVQ